MEIAKSPRQQFHHSTAFENDDEYQRRGVHAVTDLTQTINVGNDVITRMHTGTNSVTLLGVGPALTAGSFHFA